MLDNHAYNLLEQLAQEHKSLWRIKKMYQEEAGDCEECGPFWEKMVRDKEDHVEELVGLIKGHLK